MSDNTIAFLLILWCWFMLLVGYMAWERYQKHKKRERFLWQVRRWQ